MTIHIGILNMEIFLLPFLLLSPLPTEHLSLTQLQGLKRNPGTLLLIVQRCGPCVPTHPARGDSKDLSNKGGRSKD